MNRALLLPILMVAPLAFPVHADPMQPEEKQYQLCTGTTMKDWGDQKAIEQQVLDMGYTLINIRIEKACWEVKARDDRQEVYEFYIHPVSKEVVMRKHKPQE